MNYENIQLTSIRQNTYEEGKILYDIVLKYKPKNILELGTFGGYNTLWLAAALDEINKDGVVFSLDFDKADITPSADEMIKRNSLTNVFISKTDSIIDSINSYINNVDLIFIDECHYEQDKLLSKLIKNSADNKILVFHDVLCDYADEMKTPKIFSELCETNSRDYEIIHTEDDNGNPNGFGIYVLTKKIESVSKDIVEIETKPTEESRKKKKNSEKETEEHVDSLTKKENE